jgi:hypothetical protein
VPEPDPRPDYLLTNTADVPTAGADSVKFTNDPDCARFQQFMWELVSCLHEINLGLGYFKRCQQLGCDPEAARKPYDDAVSHYTEIFSTDWKAEIEHYTTWIDPAISPEGYITHVRVITQAFAPQKPGQSSSQNGVTPYPSSESA